MKATTLGSEQDCNKFSVWMRWMGYKGWWRVSNERMVGCGMDQRMNLREMTPGYDRVQLNQDQWITARSVVSWRSSRAKGDEVPQDVANDCVVSGEVPHVDGPKIDLMSAS